MDIVRAILARLQAALAWWLADIQRRPSLIGKAASLGIGLIVICCVCSVGLGAVRGTGQAVGLVATNTPSPRPTNTPEATDTPAPTATSAPSPTPMATETPIPTEVPTSGPTNTPAPTSIPPSPTAPPVIGSDVRAGDTRFQLLEVVNLGNQMKSRAGDVVTTNKTFVRLRYEVENISDKKHGIYGITILDGQGKEIKPDFFPITKEFQGTCYFAIREQLAPHEIRRCEGYYTIDPADRARMQVEGRTGIFSSDKVLIDIGILPEPTPPDSH